MSLSFITNGIPTLEIWQVADTQKHADTAANLAVVEYETEGLEPPILSVEDAVQKSSVFEILPFLYPQQVGDTSKGMAEADHRIDNSEVCTIFSLSFKFLK